MLIGNAFSLNMVKLPCTVSMKIISLDTIKRFLPYESVIGHADTARIVSSMLGVELKANRANVKLEEGDQMIIAQYTGPRLPEGAVSLPDGAKIEFVLIEVMTRMG